MAEILEACEQALTRVELVPSGGGVFEVDVNGERIYSKKATGRHAEPGEILALVERRLGSR